MTVKELRALLAQMPSDATVLVQIRDAEMGDLYWRDPGPSSRVLYYYPDSMDWSDNHEKDGAQRVVVVL